MYIFLLCGLFLGLILLIFGYVGNSKFIQIIGIIYFTLGLATAFYAYILNDTFIKQETTIIYQYEVISYDKKNNIYIYKNNNSYTTESTLDKQIRIIENDSIKPSITKYVTYNKVNLRNVIDKFLNIGMIYNKNEKESYVLIIPVGTLNNNLNN